jgi:hypothetical protein
MIVHHHETWEQEQSMSDKPGLPWGIPKHKVQPGSLKTISTEKLATFAIGQQKKSRFQKVR